MTVYKNIHELVGNTPLLQLTHFPLPNKVKLFAKLEYFNPGGSVKDRLGRELLDEAFRSGNWLKEEPSLSRRPGIRVSGWLLLRLIVEYVSFS